MIIYPPLGRKFYVSQFFGEHPEWYAAYGLIGHPGIDIPGTVGEPLHAGVAGRVYVTQAYATGICVHTQHPLGVLTYGHCESLEGTPDRTVCAGEIIAMLGNSGAHTTGAHVDVSWRPANGDYNNGYHGAVDPWPMIQEGLMERDKAGELATALRWELEEAQRERGESQRLFQEATGLEERGWELEQQAEARIAKLVSMQGGLAHAVEAALGRPVPSEFQE
jgi:hypothetical protein